MKPVAPASTGWAARAAPATAPVSNRQPQYSVRKSNWGEPEKVNRSTGSYGVREEWVYGGGSYLYFQNGVLRTIQDSQ